MHVLEGREKPQLILDNGPAHGADIVLPREWLLGIGRGILDGKARIQRGIAIVEGTRAMPLIGAALGGNHY